MESTITREGSNKASDPQARLTLGDVFLPTSAMGASYQPISIPSDVDSDKDDGDDWASSKANTSLPPAHKLRTSLPQSPPHRTSRISKSRNLSYSKNMLETNVQPSKPS